MATALRTRAPTLATLTDLPRDADGHVDVDRVVDALRRLGPTQLLHAVPGTAGAGRWSYAVPLSRSRAEDTGAGTRLITPHGDRHLGSDPFAAIDRLCARWGLVPDATVRDGPPFSGGLVGALAYDLGRRVERLPSIAAADRPPAQLLLHVAENVVAIDHERGEAWLVQRPLIEPDRSADDARAIRHVLRDPPRPAPVSQPGPQAVSTSLSERDYETAVERLLDHIARGDAFQVNLSQRLTARWTGDAHALERALRRHSPAPRAAVVEMPDVALASISPEQFLDARGREIVARPVKGTRPRGRERAEDRRLAAELEASAKDRAENVMIVDLVRNDLGRVCLPGTVRVPELAAVEPHPTVWHLVSTVQGTLRPGTGYGELLRAAFPCGSVTGTPKVRAMELVEEVEPVRRGFYCGAIGFLSAGAMATSVSIRTAVLHRDGRVDYGAGGAVVADSDPSAEHAESLAKATAFLRAVNATGIVPRSLLGGAEGDDEDR